MPMELNIKQWRHTISSLAHAAAAICGKIACAKRNSSST